MHAHTHTRTLPCSARALPFSSIFLLMRLVMSASRSLSLFCASSAVLVRSAWEAFVASYSYTCTPMACMQHHTLSVPTSACVACIRTAVTNGASGVGWVVTHERRLLQCNCGTQELTTGYELPYLLLEFGEFKLELLHIICERCNGALCSPEFGHNHAEQADVFKQQPRASDVRSQGLISSRD